MRNFAKRKKIVFRLFGDFIRWLDGIKKYRFFSFLLEILEIYFKIIKTFNKYLRLKNYICRSCLKKCLKIFFFLSKIFRAFFLKLKYFLKLCDNIALYFIIKGIDVSSVSQRSFSVTTWASDVPTTSYYSLHVILFEMR